MRIFKKILESNYLLGAAAACAAFVIPVAAFAAPALVSSAVNVRSGPGIGYARVAALPAWTRVDAGPCRSGWCAVRKGRGRGFVPTRYIRFATAGYAIRPTTAVIVGDSGYDNGWGAYSLGLMTGWAAGGWGNGYGGGYWGGGPNYYNGCAGNFCQSHFSPGWRHGWRHGWHKGWNPRWGVGPQLRPGWNPRWGGNHLHFQHGTMRAHYAGR